MKKVSFICTTYRRFTCVKRILAQFYAQTYPNKELIIFNTDTLHPYLLLNSDNCVIIINNNNDYVTGKQYTNRSEICRDAITHATGDYFMLADDDDVYLPWHIKQAVEGIEELNKDAWKPQKSFFSASKTHIELAQNIFEASIIVKMNRIREIGFSNNKNTGYEGISWYNKLLDEGNLNVNNVNYLPSYCFNWSDPIEIGGHKQSNRNEIDNPNSFDNHKNICVDYVKSPLTPISKSELDVFHRPYLDFIRYNPSLINQEYYRRYFPV